MRAVCHPTRTKVTTCLALTWGAKKHLYKVLTEFISSGGKVVLYVEPFIVYLWSVVGQANGESWGGRNELGELWGIKAL